LKNWGLDRDDEFADSWDQAADEKVYDSRDTDASPFHWSIFTLQRFLHYHSLIVLLIFVGKTFDNMFMSWALSSSFQSLS
jgi:hypothetical protein